MPLPPRRAAAALCLVLALVTGAAAQAPADGRVTPQEMRQAAAALAADPDVMPAGRRQVLAWVPHRTRTAPRVEDVPRWLRGLLNWIGDSARLLLWVVLGIGASLLAIYLVRLGARRGAAAGLPQAPAPTHVRELDIRPESLPADVGAAAAALWERGEARAALALLYRGLLSQLVHVHAAPIRASSTEDECAQAAAARLTGPQTAYVRRVIRTWQDAVYGGLMPAPEGFLALCAGLGALREPPAGAAGAA